jgi:phage terminase small subunit
MPRHREYVGNPPTPPAHLTDEQAELFAHAAEFLMAKGAYGAGDVVALEHYAVAATLAREIDRALREHGAVDAEGRVSALVAHSKDAHTNLRSWVRALGLAPAARRDLPRGDDDGEPSALADLLPPQRPRGRSAPPSTATRSRMGDVLASAPLRRTPS